MLPVLAVRPGKLCPEVAPLTAEGRSILATKGARASPFRAQLISEVPLEIAQTENRSFELDECLNLCYDSTVNHERSIVAALVAAIVVNGGG